VRTRRTTHSTATATTPTTAATTATTAATIATAAIATTVAAALLRPRQEIDDIEELTLLLGVRRRILTGQHAHEPHVVGAPAHHLERLHQPGEPIALDAELLFDLGRRQRSAFIDDSGRARVAGRFFRGRRRVCVGGLRLLARGLRRLGRRLRGRARGLGLGFR